MADLRTFTTMPPLMPLFFDGHLDLAYLAVNGRDMLAPPASAQGPHPPACITLPALAAADVRFALATIFTEPDGSGPEGYPAADADRARRVGRAQLEVYLTWQDRGLIALDLPRAFRVDPGVGEIRGGMGVAEAVPVSLQKQAATLLRSAPAKLHAGILMECADPLAGPDDVAWWRSRGLCAVGLAWAKSSRYAGGNSTTTGLSAQGRDLVAALDHHRIVHDLSHLSDRAADELLSLAAAPVMASHSNCRALVGGGGHGENQRHLRDDIIQEIARRGGVVGINLFSKFLKPGLDAPARASVDDVAEHADRVAQLMGRRTGVGIGSDMDGGFAADRLPLGIDGPGALPLIGEALRRRGWSDDDVAGFEWRNWAAFWRTHARQLTS